MAILGSIALSVALAFGLDTNPWVFNGIYLIRLMVAAQLFWVRMSTRDRLFTVGLTRRNLVFISTVGVVFITSMNHFPAIGRGVPAIGNILGAIFLFFLSQAITQQRLLNLAALGSRLLVLLGVALILTGFYSLLVAWIQDSPGLFFLNSFIVSFVLLMLLDPLRSLVRYATDRLLTQPHRRVEQLLREAQIRLTGITDYGGIFQTILLTLEQTLQPDWAALFILRGDGTKYRRVRMIGREAEGAPLREILADHPLLKLAENLRKRGDVPVLLDQLLESEMDRSASRTQKEILKNYLQGLKALGSNLLIPIFDSGKILGFVTAYAPQPPEPWGNNWGLLTVLYPFFENAGQSMRNLEVYARQREKERLAALGEMSAGLAHEIRNPLGAIKGAAQYLNNSGSDRPETPFFQVIIEEVDRLNRVVTQFLDYSKPATSDLSKVDLVRLTERAIELLRPSIPSTIQLHLSKPRNGVAVEVMGVGEQLHQVILNLIQNSFRALESKSIGTRSVRIAIELEGTVDHPEAHLSVEDDGPGIKRENLDKLFIPFFTTSPKGTGLGLSICQKIIVDHRGRIEVASEEGRFARFTVILPLAGH